MTKRTSLGVHITDEDIAFARRQNRYQCAIVRAIQRELPEATRVMADTETIRFTLEEHTGVRTRYIFETPKRVVNTVIRPFDLGEPIQEFDFTLTTAIDAYETKPRDSKDRATERTRLRSKRNSTPNYGNDHTTNRFLIPPQEPEVTADQALAELREKLTK